MPLLCAVTDPVAVTPDSRLQAAALAAGCRLPAAGWPIIKAVGLP
jgi:phosphoserine phosphatase